jgi:C1A family cysteine protease
MSNVKELTDIPPGNLQQVINDFKSEGCKVDTIKQSDGNYTVRAYCPDIRMYLSDKPSMGWLRDYPDFRDHSIDHDEVSNRHKALGQKKSIKSMLSETGITKITKAGLPLKVDLREWFSPVENQGNLGSCTANAGVGMIEYFERRAFGNHIDASRLFLYKATRNLMRTMGDSGAYLRSTMGAMVLFGVAPEQYWPYVIENFDKEPSSFCYAFAQNYQAIQYYRLDPSGTSKIDHLKRIKTNLATGLPSMFGFTVYNSIQQAALTGMIPFPTKGENIAGGHAIIAVGFDDNMKIKNANKDGVETTGALLIRNSWGEEWGEKGYGWLPYEYVLKGLAVDWWSLLKNEWIDTKNFGQE